MRQSYAYGEPIGYIDADIYTDCDGNSYAYADSDCYGNSHIHAYGDSNSYAYADSHSYGDSNSYAYTDSYGYSYSYSYDYCNRYSNCDGIAACYTDATASSDTAAPTVRRADCSLIWELASEPREFPDSIVVTTPFMWWQTTSQLQQRANCRIATQ
jgi:hypothetical protein